MNLKEYLVVVRGGGDLATGIICRLRACGFPVVILETETPTVIRRTVALATAVFNGTFSVEGSEAVTVYNDKELYEILAQGRIPLLIDPVGASINRLKPAIVVDAILAKQNLGTTMDMAPIVIGVGPGFEAGRDVHAVIETNRGHHLGKVIYEGGAEPDTGVPGAIGGESHKRVLRAPSDGVIRCHVPICSQVEEGDLIATVQDLPIRSELRGTLRGLIMDGMEVKAGLKIGDVDPRCKEEYCHTVSDKARAVGGGVVEGILHLLGRESV